MCNKLAGPAGDETPDTSIRPRVNVKIIRAAQRRGVRGTHGLQVTIVADLSFYRRLGCPSGITKNGDARLSPGNLLRCDCGGVHKGWTQLASPGLAQRVRIGIWLIMYFPGVF